MKYFLAVVMLISFSVPNCFGEGKVVTRKVRLADFTTKTTKIVLSGSALIDATLQAEVTSRWHLSPYEFCSISEYDSLKESPEYYFLRLVKGTFKSEESPGLLFLSLIKGGKASSQDPMNQMFEVVSIPVASAENSTGREFIYMSAFIDIIQEFVEDAMETETKGYAGLGIYNSRMPKAYGKRIFLSEGDLGFDFTAQQRSAYLGEYFKVLGENEVDGKFEASENNALVSLSIAPVNARNGSYCYKMLISADTHQLYYYRRHRITARAWKGFQFSDIKAVSARDKNKRK